MKTLARAQLELVENEFMPSNDELEGGKFYYSKQYETAKHLCVCGCKTIVVTPMKKREDWGISIKENGKFDLIGSVLQRSGCKSHYIITNSIANIV